MSNPQRNEQEEATSRIGVIGCGARISTVIEKLRECAPGVSIVAVCDSNPASLAQFLSVQAQPAAAVCMSPADLCQREDVDWVFIGSWNCFHAEHAITALQNGKHVFCEKPLALSLADAIRIHEAWRASQSQFALGLVLRYSPLYRLARQFIDDGKLGKLLSFEFNETLSFNHGGFIHGNWRRFSENSGSHLLEKCCHDIDLALWLADDLPSRIGSFGGNTFFVPENVGLQEKVGKSPQGETAFQSWPSEDSVNPFTAEKDIVDHQVAILEFNSGLRASFHTHCMSAIPERRFYMIGSEGALRFDAYSGRLEYCAVGWSQPVCSYQPIVGDGHAGADMPMARELADCMANRRLPAAGIAEGVKSLVVVEALDQSMKEGRIVDLKKTWQEIEALA